MKKEDIDISKIIYQFWHQCYGYYYGNGFICLFSDKMKAVDEDGEDIKKIGKTTCVYKAVGTFSLYKTTESNGKLFKCNAPLKIITIEDAKEGRSIDEFRQIGIFKCMEQYMQEIKKNISEPKEDILSCCCGAIIKDSRCSDCDNYIVND